MPEEGEDSEDKIRSRLLHFFKHVKVEFKPQQIVTATRLGWQSKIKGASYNLRPSSLLQISLPTASQGQGPSQSSKGVGHNKYTDLLDSLA